jgi:dUTP pyrophosphatase
MIENNQNPEEENFDELLDLLNSFDDNSPTDYDKFIDALGINFDDLDSEAIRDAYLLDLEFNKSNPDATDPIHAYPTDSGFDLCSTEDVWIHSFDRKLVPTGLHFNIPDGYEIQIRSKSGLALKQGLMVLNSPGTIDQGYTGEIQVILFNTTKENVKITKGQKIAQGVLCPVVSGRWIRWKQKEVLEVKDRNNKGFGSSGL